MYKAMDVAHYIIQREWKENRAVSNLRLQKLLYFAQGFFYSCGEEGCFKDKIEAWDFGPVVPEVYRVYKKYGSCIIINIPKNMIDEISDEHKKMIDMVLDECSDKSTFELVKISKNQTPWMITYRPYMDNNIKQDTMRRFFFAIK